MALSDAEFIGDGRPDGTVIGRTATELVAFHGVTPVAQAATFAAVTTAAPTLTAYGFTFAQATGLLNNINAIRTALVNKGIISAT